MAGRNFKEGLEYLRLSVDFGSDDAIELIDGEFGARGFRVMVKLFQRIYKNKGYYIEWNEKRKILFAGSVGETAGLLDEIITRSFKWGLFDEPVFTQHGILTSADIQRDYLDAVKRRERVEIIKDYSLCDISVFSNAIYVYRNSIDVVNNDHSRVEKSIVEQSNMDTGKLKSVKTEKISAPAAPPLPKKSKEKPESEPYWQALVKVWFDFGTSKFGEQPSFGRDDPKILMRIIHLLKKRADLKKQAWDESSAVFRMQKFLDAAFTDEWLAKNFLLSNLEKQFDKVIQAQNARAKTAPAAQKTVLTKIQREINYLFSRYLEGDRSITNVDASHMEFVSKLGLISWNGSVTAAIQNQAAVFMRENNLSDTQANRLIITQKFGLLKFFELRAAGAAKEIFK